MFINDFTYFHVLLRRDRANHFSQWHFHLIRCGSHSIPVKIKRVSSYLFPPNKWQGKWAQLKKIESVKIKYINVQMFILFAKDLIVQLAVYYHAICCWLETGGNSNWNSTILMIWTLSVSQVTFLSPYHVRLSPASARLGVVWELFVNPLAWVPSFVHAIGSGAGGVSRC